VSAKDKSTGKEQSIRIERTGSLDEQEIERMVKDAEAHAEEDKRQKEVITSRNELDNLIFSTEKSMAEHGGKLSEKDRKSIEAAIKEAKEKMEKASSKEEFEAIRDDLSKKAQKIGEILYAEMQKEQQQAGGGATQDANFDPNQMHDAGQQGEQQKSDGPIDADFEVVDDDK